MIRKWTRYVPDYATEDELEEWASKKMESITDLHVVALNMAGWKIVRQHEEDIGFVTPKWPYDSKHTGYDCPEWCEDMRPTAKVLSFTNDGKAPDQPA